ncbi:c-type cytochrome [Rubritalea spongiae]|uniref:C-type cytochrome n=1 Tax=Rubritalea spongiae TaxID=430797 RepID=A0ABW5DYE6_9BACT
MKPLTTILAALTLSVITACSVHTNDDPLAPSPALAAQSNIPLEDLGRGHAIFMRQCTQCHEKRIPNEIPTDQWHVIVPGMAWNAGLSKEEEKLVTDYVIAASQVKTEQTR